MSSAIAAREHPKHGGLQRPGAKRQIVRYELPLWHGWQWRSESARIIRWIESTLIQPVGVGAGQPIKIATFQRRLIKRFVDSLATFISIPAGNGKTTLMAAVALERLCRGDDYVEVDVVATKEEQAGRLINTCIRMIECVPELIPLFEFYRRQSVLEYRATGSRMTAQPARLSAVQGLNSDLALIDEIGMVPPELVVSMLARLGKKPRQRVIGFGTPGGLRGESMLEKLRGMAHLGELPPGVEFVEYAAEPGCAIDDREQWRKANPAIGAGFLAAESLPLKAAVMSEAEFRAYHLGQPVASSGPWLPLAAWADCVESLPPPDGARVVLGVWGSYRRQIGVVGCTLDGSLFFGWWADKPSDGDLADVLHKACDQWEVAEITHKPHIRLSLMGRLADEGLPVVPWPSDRATDVESASAFYQAVAEQTLAHDHADEVTEHVSRLTAKVDRQGMPRLVEAADADVSLAFAARAAWWRACALAAAPPKGELTIY